jgi:hypothetical protein
MGGGDDGSGGEGGGSLGEGGASGGGDDGPGGGALIGNVDSRYGGGPGLNSMVHSMFGPRCILGFLGVVGREVETSGAVEA